MAKYVIIGNSIAACGCIEGIREIDKEGSITVIGEENHFVYGRPLISYLLMGKTSLDKIDYRDKDYYINNKVETILGVRATSINKEKKEVVLSNNQIIPYEKLMLATGSVPFLPKMAGIENVKNRFSFMTLDDALSLEKVLTKDSKVLVVGAGLIGLKCVEGIKDRVGKITVVDLADRVLPSILDSRGSEYIKTYLESLGVEFILSDSVAKFDKNTAILKSEKKVDFDILVTAVGVRPNVQLLSDIGGKVEKGIVIDNCSRTSIKDIYAGGDNCVCHDISCDTDRIVAILPNAYFLGRAAGRTMAGVESSFDQGVPMNSIGFFNLHVVTAGSYIGDKDVVCDDGKNYKVLFTKDNVLKGFIMIGDISRAGIYTSLVRSKANLKELDYSLIRVAPQLMAFKKEKREYILGRSH